jgi:hypothetical protein
MEKPVPFNQHENGIWAARRGDCLHRLSMNTAPGRPVLLGKVVTNV